MLQLFNQFQSFQTKTTQINQLTQKISNYQKNWQFLRPNFSLKLLEFDDDYLKLQNQLHQFQKEKRDLIFNLANNLEKLNPSYSE